MMSYFLINPYHEWRVPELQMRLDYAQQELSACVREIDRLRMELNLVIASDGTIDLAELYRQGY